LESIWNTGVTEKPGGELRFMTEAELADRNFSQLLIDTLAQVVSPALLRMQRVKLGQT